VARTFQIVQPFAEMTVLENVLAGGLFAGRRATLTDASQASVRCLEFVGLDRFARDPASQLSLANRQRLELAKSLAMQPRLLFLDDVNAGLNSAEIDGALELIRKIAATGITIVIIERVLRIVLSLVSRLVVLHHGALLSDGVPSVVLNDPAVIKAYATKPSSNSNGRTIRTRSRSGNRIHERPEKDRHSPRAGLRSRWRCS
jgi:branched-chain amino acid transport system ATP-binding protein